MNKFGNILKTIRTQQDIRQSDLAKAIGVSPSTIGMYEQGRRDPDSDTVIKLAEYFNVTTDYLLGNSNPFGVKWGWLTGASYVRGRCCHSEKAAIHRVRRYSNRACKWMRCHNQKEGPRSGGLFAILCFLLHCWILYTAPPVPRPQAFSAWITSIRSISLTCLRYPFFHIQMRLIIATSAIAMLTIRFIYIAYSFQFIRHSIFINFIFVPTVLFSE